MTKVEIFCRQNRRIQTNKLLRKFGIGKNVLNGFILLLLILLLSITEGGDWNCCWTFRAGGGKGLLAGIEGIICGWGGRGGGGRKTPENEGREGIGCAAEGDGENGCCWDCCCVGRLGSRILPHCIRHTSSRRMSSKLNLVLISKQLTRTVLHLAPVLVHWQTVQGVGDLEPPTNTVCPSIKHVVVSLHNSRLTCPIAEHGTRGFLWN